MLTHGSLFSGVGGAELAAQWAGWQNVLHCEINPFGQQILNYYWPNSISYHDIKTTDFTIHRGTIDVLSGGFPCQPYSQAGKRLGKEDDRHLWPEMLRAIREIQPGWVVGENVLGLTNWNGGLVFEEVQTDLETEGYEVQAYVLPACSVNAPHRRDRVWFIAHSTSKGRKERQQIGRWKDEKENRTGLDIWPERFGSLEYPTNSQVRGRNDSPTEKVPGREGSEQTGICNSKQVFTNSDGFGLWGGSDRAGKSGFIGQNGPGDYWGNFPSESPVRSRNDGVPSGLDGITIPKHRNESIKAYGNAIVPQVIYQIFKSINSYELITP